MGSEGGRGAENVVSRRMTIGYLVSRCSAGAAMQPWLPTVGSQRLTRRERSPFLGSFVIIRIDRSHVPSQPPKKSVPSSSPPVQSLQTRIVELRRGVLAVKLLKVRFLTVFSACNPGCDVPIHRPGRSSERYSLQAGWRVQHAD